MGRSAMLGVVGVALLVAAVTAGGYLIGESRATTETQAQRAQRAALVKAQEAAHDSAYSAARRRGLVKGLRIGHSEGEKAGRADGASQGGGAAETELVAQAEAAAAAEPAPVPAEPLVCDGAVADDATYAACLQQSGEPIPAGFPGAVTGAPAGPPFPTGE